MVAGGGAFHFRMKGFYLIALFSKPSKEKILSIPNRSFVDGVKFTAMKASFFAFREYSSPYCAENIKFCRKKFGRFLDNLRRGDLKVSLIIGIIDHESNTILKKILVDFRVWIQTPKKLQIWIRNTSCMNC
jgi:hypothetical protein